VKCMAGDNLRPIVAKAYTLLARVVKPPGRRVYVAIRILRATLLRLRSLGSGGLLYWAVSRQFAASIRLRSDPRFFIQPTVRVAILELARNYSLYDEEGVLQDAERLCAHTFDLLGSSETFLGEKIDWHMDWKSGFRWPRKLYVRLLPVFNAVDNTDGKVPYELSRFQHLPTLGKAYWITGDGKYSKEFVDEIEDWIVNNPPQYGVNWTCSMDIAIRAVNWIWGYYFFKDSPEVNDKFIVKLLNNLLIHGRHIRTNLERPSRLKTFGITLLQGKPIISILRSDWRGINGNHYLSNLAGLIYIGMFFSMFVKGRKWLNFAINEIMEEMAVQVYPDGVYYEGSISYHRLATEIFLSTTLLCLKNGISFPNCYMERLEKMIEFVMYYTKPDGTAPQIGDNDDGRLHILSNYCNWNRVDHRYLLSIGAVLFNRPDFKEAAGRFHEEAFWLMGEEGKKKFDDLPQQNGSIVSKDFPHGGYFIMRSNNNYLIVDCIQAGFRARSGHMHNSRLSFELFARDKSFIIDPGTYTYTAEKEMRNLFRSTKYHNTVVVDGEEQNSFNENELFSLECNANIKINKWEVTTEYDMLDAEHSGYMRLCNPIIHRRQVLSNKKEGYWVIKDILSGQGPHQFDLYFHFAPFEIEIDSEFPLVVKTRTEGVNLVIIPLETEGVAMQIERGWISYRYGVKEESAFVRYSKTSQASVNFCNILYPYDGELDINGIIEKVKVSRSKFTELYGGTL
jgi:hypothetical protein